MTKSRTLRKAAAVALSLAMAFSVATVSTDASAAAKPSLKSSKVTVKVKKSKSVAIKNAKLVTKVTVKVKNSKVAAAKASKKAVKVTGKTAGKTKVVVTIKYKSGKKVKTVKKNLTVTVKPISTKDEDNTDVIQGKITIESEYALQADNSVLVGDPLKVNLPSDLGVFQELVWICDGQAMNASTSTSTGATDAMHAIATKAGTWTCKGVTTKGTTYISNELTVVKDEVPLKFEACEILEDYDHKDANDKIDGSKVNLDTKSTQLIAHFTVNRLYNGTYGIVDPNEATKANKNKKYEVKDKKLPTGAVPKDAPLTSYSEVSDNAGKLFYVGGYGKKTDLYFVLTDEVKRGGVFAGYVDQAAIGTDTVGKGSENLSANATAPYVKAPASFALTQYGEDNKATAELRGEDGKALAWLNSANAITFKVCSKTGSTIGALDTFADATATADHGVYTISGTFNNNYLAAKVELKAGVFGEAAIPLTSNVIERAQDGMDTLELTQSTTNPSNAVVKITNLKSDCGGTVYVFQGAENKGTTQLITGQDKKFAKSATVAGGATEVEVANVFGTSVPDGTNNNNKFAVLFVPTDAAKYKNEIAGQQWTKAAPTTIPAAFTLTQQFKKYAADDGIVASTSSGGFVIGGLDQFGKAVAAETTNVPGIVLTKTGTGNPLYLAIDADCTGYLYTDVTNTTAATTIANNTSYYGEYKDANNKVVNTFTLTKDDNGALKLKITKVD